MSKIIIKPNKYEDIPYLLKLNIDGIILPIEKLSVASSFFISVDEAIKIKTDKEKIALINKIMHSSDLEKLEEVLIKIEKSDIDKIMFYDLAVYQLAKKLNINKKLVIYQEHLNRSINSNKFYQNLGINYSYITSDITIEEIKEIKDNTNMKIFYTVYGSIPLFISKRKLLSNYFDYIEKEKNKGNYYIQNKEDRLYINEEDNGTIIYNNKINLINEINNIEFIDYLVLDFNNDNNYNIINNFINKITDGKDYYLGFYNTKTIFKVK